MFGHSAGKTLTGRFVNEPAANVDLALRMNSRPIRSVLHSLRERAPRWKAGRMAPPYRSRARRCSDALATEALLYTRDMDSWRCSGFKGVSNWGAVTSGTCAVGRMLLAGPQRCG